MTFLLNRFLALILLLSIGFVHAQDVPLNWHLHGTQDGVDHGIDQLRAYQDLLAGRQSSPVIVAIIDSGTETTHPELSPNIWTNEDEIPNNGIDDDKNGYIDDIHGWSFIGGKNGDVQWDNLEITRDYRILRAKYAGKTEAQIPADERKAYDEYLAVDKNFTERLAEAKAQVDQFDQIFMVLDMAQETFTKELGKSNFTAEEVEAFQPKDEYMGSLKDVMLAMLKDDLRAQVEEGKVHFTDAVDYAYNLDFDPRNLVGDDYSNPREHAYGNNHIDGPAAEHGTHVAGIIGALRDGDDADGVCGNVRLMIIRCVPDGDERDKDVANSIRYAADNGARVINMSFGKSRSPFKDVVDEAVKYAESKGVLFIHAAGNDGKDIDHSSNFPNDKYLDGGTCSTWIEVGATGADANQLMADFSNFGRKSVDVFAPGVDIYSTMTGDSYKKESGTSMAAPVTTGVAAVLFSYFPSLTAVQVKEIILKSSQKHKYEKVFLADSNPEDKKVPSTRFKRVCVTGGVVNLYNAVKLAAEMAHQ